MGNDLRLTFQPDALIDTFHNKPLSQIDITFPWSATDTVVHDTEPPKVRVVIARDGRLEIEFTEEVDPALEQASTALWGEMMMRLTDGDEARGWLSMVMLYRALARAGQEEIAAAQWDWRVAEYLVPELNEADLSKYKPVVGEALKSNMVFQNDTKPPKPFDHLSKGVVAPNFTVKTNPKYPRGVRGQCTFR